MLKDCLEIFKEIYLEEGERCITDSYLPSEGTYVLVNFDGVREEVYELKHKDLDDTDNVYQDFCKMDYLSKLLDMNKPIDATKTIHSNNYLAFYVKKTSLFPDKVKGKSKLNEQIIDKYYDVFLNPLEKYKADKGKKDIFLKAETKYGSTASEKVNFCREWIKANIFKLAEEIKNDKNYLKIFFKASLEEYDKESKKYILPNIYNNTSFNIELEGSIYGVPNNNMGLNAKKPFLIARSRINPTPYLLAEEEVLFQKKFFDYLSNQVEMKKYNIYLSPGKIEALKNDEMLQEDFSGFYLRLRKEKNEAEIQDFDVIPRLETKIGPIPIEPTIPIDYGPNKANLNYTPIERLEQVKNLMNIIFFSKFLASNFFTKPKDINLKEPKVKEVLLRYKEGFSTWFYKGDARIIKANFANFSLELIENSLAQNYLIRAKEQYCLRAAIIHYFEGGRKMGDILTELADKLREKINKKDTLYLESDQEYYFAAGQIFSYLISLNKSSKVTHSLINPILKCRNNTQLKAEMSKLFMKYNHAINKPNKRFDNLQSMVMGYEIASPVDKNILIAGYLYSNLIYESKGDKD